MPILLKLFFLGVRQASKPMANALKRAAQSSEVFTVVLAATGRTLHRVTLQITRASEGKEQLATVAKLAEKAAIQRGADLLSEGFIYSVAGATVYYEYNMQQREKAEKAEKDAEKERARREEMRKNEERQWDEVSAAELRAARRIARRRLPRRCDRLPSPWLRGTRAQLSWIPNACVNIWSPVGSSLLHAVVPCSSDISTSA